MASSLYPWLHVDYEHIIGRYLQGGLHHASLFVGPQGIGKRSLAKAVAERLLCRDEASLYPCGQCKTCLLLASGSHPDYYQIEPEEKSRFIKVDQIRQLIEKLSASAQQGTNKVVFLQPADMMNLNAANALLKSLEEPTRNTYFLLVSDAMDRLLATVKSRCHLQRIAIPDRAYANNYLQGKANNSDDVSLALALAGGRPLAAEAFLDQDAALTPKQIFDILQNCVVGRSTLSSTAKALAAVSLSQQILPLLEPALKLALEKKMLISRPAVTPINALADALLEKGWAVHQFFEMLETCQTARKLLSSSANPNEILLLEDLLIRLSNR